MANINISFDNKNYPILETTFSAALANLYQHLSTKMNGTGAQIELDDQLYNIDATKLSTATNTFVNYLNAIAGNGSKVVIGGVEYSLDSAKIADTIDKLHTAFSGLYGPLAPGLYETGAIALYQAGDRDGASAMMKTSWEDLVASGAIVVSEGPKLPENLPEINEYGFYFGVEYAVSMRGATLRFTFNEDSSTIFNSPDGVMDIPAGVIVYGDHTIDMSALDLPVFEVSDDGMVISADGIEMSLGEPAPPKGEIYLGVVNGETTLLEGELVIASENSITGIAQSTFGNQNSLTGIMMHNNITSIGPFAFSACSNLSNVIISSSVMSIGEFAFQNCTSLTSIVIPDSVTSIDKSAFRNCHGLTSITIPDSVTSIGDGAFCDCRGLTSITIPDSVTSIGGSAFEYCKGLTSITIPDGVTSINKSTFDWCKGLTSITIPDSVTSIGEFAFYNCTSLIEIEIPDSVTSIGTQAFAQCGILTSVTVLAETPPSIADYVFHKCSTLTEIKVLASSVDAYKAADGWSEYADIIVAI